jgi:cytidine deaminase
MNFSKEILFSELMELKNNAYVPYSNFRVASIVYLKNGEKVVGVNVENAAYNPTICAERCVLPQVYAQGYDANDVELMTLYTDSDNVGTPCGTCRQTMTELLQPEQIMMIFNKKGYCKSVTVSELLPDSFTEKDL